MSTEYIAYIGPMWSGKTTGLLSFFTQCTHDNLKVGIFDHPNNKRCSSRDLGALCANAQTFDQKTILEQSWDVLIFDEVHLYDCFQNAPIFLSTIQHVCARVVVMAGIYYDFYHDYKPFPIWGKISLLDHCEFRNCYSVMPCFKCGTILGVQYTVSIGEPDQRVGDFYRNTCRSCGIKYLVEWKSNLAQATAV